MSFHDDDDDGSSNDSRNPTFTEVLTASRRQLLRGGLGAAGLFLIGCHEDWIHELPPPKLPGGGAPKPARALLGFEGVPISTEDRVVVPEGYRADVLYAWGDPISRGPAFRQDASNTAADQEQQAGMHHDGMHFFPLDDAKGPSRRGLLVVNHEYTDDGLLHPGGMEPWTADKIAKSLAAHGVSVVELRFDADCWHVARPSRYARRITGRTPIAISGPAAGHRLMKTAADPAGTTVLGTLNNCAHGHTPWGTYLTCEENWNYYFVNPTGLVESCGDARDEALVVALQARYGITATGGGYRYHEHEARFDAAAHPNEPHRFGWVVEIDPFDPASVPVKRTALGRTKHEGAWVVEANDGRAVVYMGDDERFEYIYKFVGAEPWRRVHRRGESPLDAGTLLVARFNADGTGDWIELTFGKNGLTAENGFESQAEVLVQTRRAADVAGATKMDRPEWIATRAGTGEVYCTLTNNNRRGAMGSPGPDAANPRPDNVFGHIVRWREAGGDFGALTFRWDLFVSAGDPANPDPNKKGDLRGDLFGSPDGLWFDDDGRLWIQTDVSTSVLGKGDYANLGNNQMLAADPNTREIRRFLTGPRGCEVTGVVTTPDKRTMFVNIQHPGEPATERNDPANPKAVSSWPDGPFGARPRSATIVIRKLDGGIIGT